MSTSTSFVKIWTVGNCEFNDNFLTFFGLYLLLALCSRNYWNLLNHHLMANIWEKSISILVGNLNLGRSHLITTVLTWSPCIHRSVFEPVKLFQFELIRLEHSFLTIFTKTFMFPQFFFNFLGSIQLSRGHQGECATYKEMVFCFQNCSEQMWEKLF